MEVRLRTKASSICEPHNLAKIGAESSNPFAGSNEINALNGNAPLGPIRKLPRSYRHCLREGMKLRASLGRKGGIE
jgi:hypothetical protein